MNDIKAMQKYVARASMSTSALRAGRHAKPGIKSKMREHLFNNDVLSRFSKPEKFEYELDNLTKEFVKLFKNDDLPWGRSRKLANIYLRDASYNYYLRKAFGLAKIEKLLEVPIDSFVNERLRREPEAISLPPWKGVLGITAKSNAIYQDVAAEIARRNGYPRHLIDVDAWGVRGD